MNTNSERPAEMLAQAARIDLEARYVADPREAEHLRRQARELEARATGTRA